MLLQLLQSGPAPDTRARVLSSGALNMLLRMLGHRPAGATTSAASAVLQALVATGDVDMQNEIAAQVVEGRKCQAGSLAHCHFQWIAPLVCMLVKMHIDSDHPRGEAREAACLDSLGFVPTVSRHTLRPAHTDSHFPSQGGGLYTVFELTASWHGSITHSMLRLLPALTQARGILGPFSRTPYCISASLPDVIRVLFPRAIPLSRTSTPALRAHPPPLNRAIPL